MSLSRNPDPVPKNIHRPCVQPRDGSVYLSLFTGFSLPQLAILLVVNVLKFKEIYFFCTYGTTCYNKAVNCRKDRIIATTSLWSPTCSTLMSNSPWTFLPLNTFALQVEQRLEYNYVSHPSSTHECKILTKSWCRYRRYFCRDTT